MDASLAWRAAGSGCTAEFGVPRRKELARFELTRLFLHKNGSSKPYVADARMILLRNNSPRLSAAWDDLKRFVQASTVRVGPTWPPPRSHTPAHKRNASSSATPQYRDTLDYRDGQYVLLGEAL